MNTAAIFSSTTKRRYRTATGRAAGGSSSGGAGSENGLLDGCPSTTVNAKPLGSALAVAEALGCKSKRDALVNRPGLSELPHHRVAERRNPFLNRPSDSIARQGRDGNGLAWRSEERLIALKRCLQGSPYQDIRALQLGFENEGLEIIGVLHSYYHKQLVIEHVRSVLGATNWIDRVIVDSRS